MSQIFSPPNIQILAYKTFSINSQASVPDGVPLVCGVFLYMNDPLSDQSDTVGIKCSLKDIPPSIMAIASAEMRHIKQSERDIRVEWITDDRVYVKEPTFTFGMVKIKNPDIEMLGSLHVPTSPTGCVSMGSNFDPSATPLSHAQGSNLIDTQNRYILGHNGSAVPAQAKGIKQDKDHVNGLTRSSSSLTAGYSNKEYLDGAFADSKIKCEDET
ncbi:hypothetical protein TWF569_000756 [Orbilia oligospora]|uniref:Uncharacterized protein n=1 Tax=Orbilia oligospora TaxID=2813651 RepID=A0A7C8ND36_ORBOL|nr:hypothetical protein TWF102_005529 [Orbilia oligospora]KAF3103601.1 hypothetical protein TWF103_007118 [Orbilia oligospora]KAF3125648.1 hypothetical protein TWF569_000756 [Orbilia oligospora]KAF3128347.1 hypothetical protein TWF703_009583 [Orbilia oligospora]